MFARRPHEPRPRAGSSTVALAAWTCVLAGGTSALTGLACGSSQRPPLAKAGSDRDDGAGDLARASQRPTAGGDSDESDPFASDSRRTASRWEAPSPSYPLGGALYGGAPYGGLMYGGATYANWVVPQWNYSPPNRVPRYNVLANLSGSIEGTVTWVGAPPPKVNTACGTLDHPTLRVGTDKAARGVIVFIEKISVGRASPYYPAPITVGGTVAKHGCTFAPAAQIVAPLPGSLTIHGDDTRTRLKITTDAGGSSAGAAASVASRMATTLGVTAATKKAPSAHELQEGGFVRLEAKPGVTRVESEDGKLSPAWVIGIDTPYYAITDDNGRYRIDELAPGAYEVTFWQAPVVTANANGTWSYGSPIVVRRSVRVGAKTAQLSVALR